MAMARVLLHAGLWCLGTSALPSQREKERSDTMQLQLFHGTSGFAPIFRLFLSSCMLHGVAKDLVDVKRRGDIPEVNERVPNLLLGSSHVHVVSDSTLKLKLKKTKGATMGQSSRRTRSCSPSIATTASIAGPSSAI